MNLQNNGQKPSVFFIGICGISMSALAKYLIINGFKVGGSDTQQNSISTYLQSLGCEIFAIHSENNIKNYNIIVYNSAINQTNPELVFAKKENKVIIKRIELLQMIAKGFESCIGISGSHGKTTTTAMLAHVLLHSQIGFTSHVGGIDNCLSNLYQNGKQIFLTEVCEFAKNIDFFTADVASVLNVDNDHLNCYKDIFDLKNHFYDFLYRAKIRVVNVDDESLANYSKTNACVTFAMKKEADYTAKIICNNSNGIAVRFYEKDKKLFDIKLKVMGEYNVYNALCAVAIAKTVNISNKAIIQGISSFTGVERRNEFIGIIQKSKVFADYCHHPSEIKCLLNAYKTKNGKLTVVFQPHTYSRTKLLFKDFINVLGSIDNVVLYKTYPAREVMSDGYSAKFLADNIPQSRYFDNIESLMKHLKQTGKCNNTILILGAGDLYQLIKSKLQKN